MWGSWIGIDLTWKIPVLATECCCPYSPWFGRRKCWGWGTDSLPFSFGLTQCNVTSSQVIFGFDFSADSQFFGGAALSWSQTFCSDWITNVDDEKELDEGFWFHYFDFDFYFDVDFGDWFGSGLGRIGLGWLWFDFDWFPLLWLWFLILRLFFDIWCCFFSFIFLGFKFELIWFHVIGFEVGFDLDWLVAGAALETNRGGTIRKMDRKRCACMNVKAESWVARSKISIVSHAKLALWKHLASWQRRSQAQRNFQTNLAIAWNHIERHLWNLCFHYVKIHMYPDSKTWETTFKPLAQFWVNRTSLSSSWEWGLIADLGVLINSFLGLLLFPTHVLQVGSTSIPPWLVMSISLLSCRYVAIRDHPF